ncbi:5-carboxymethyl-2-hydroxymuconate isomerase [Paramagnetospirillum marisnigri]|uniref:5-carboxymethyl-2-hydroxymuconate isomerase n=1 Tax=Paramagnetospirillum marisnigri TaxID=1285242 RepID=A0A178MDW3_9PROT|nr:5-carboxymethyl-2-hydroxymuconate Delta-isomerase [Paramagnetospirillum marisnigri]OAN46706.1 5-carboxymethyl-2-hydroxymuconate isomerase [Paramagnetospirillum marisnigri]
MPHFIAEYTDNIKDRADIRGMLKKVTCVLLDQGGIYPIGGIRARAIELHDYVMADDQEDYAFVHATLKIGAGRSEAVKKKTCDELFEMMKDHFAPLFAAGYFALSMELYEFDEGATYKHNNVHARFKKA